MQPRLKRSPVMKTTQTDVVRAANKVGLSEEQSSALWQALVELSADRPSFEAVHHIAYYFGALIVAGAMGWFVSEAFDRLPGWQLSFIGLAYGVAALVAGHYFSRRPGLRILGGLCATVAVCMTPLAVFGIEKACNLWPHATSGRYYEFHPLVRASWIYMEAATVLVGLFVLRFFRFPFITAPVAYALWYMSMDVTAFLFHANWTFHQQCWISIAFGAIMLLTSFVADQKRPEDYAFWGYLFGMLTLWGGLSLLVSGNEWGKLIYACLNCGFVIISVLLDRRVFLIFGALGIFGYLTDLAHTLFRDSIFFPFALSVVGIVMIGIGVLIQKKMPQLQSAVYRLPWRRAARQHQ